MTNAPPACGVALPDMLGGNVIPGYLTPEMRTNMLAARPPGYDYLLIDNVLEHVGDPVGFMEQ